MKRSIWRNHLIKMMIAALTLPLGFAVHANDAKAEIIASVATSQRWFDRKDGGMIRGDLAKGIGAELHYRLWTDHALSVGVFATRTRETIADESVPSFHNGQTGILNNEVGVSLLFMEPARSIAGSARWFAKVQPILWSQGRAEGSEAFMDSEYDYSFEYSTSGIMFAGGIAFNITKSTGVGAEVGYGIQTLGNVQGTIDYRGQSRKVESTKALLFQTRTAAIAVNHRFLN
jgi:hypothetical protein